MHKTVKILFAASLLTLSLACTQDKKQAAETNKAQAAQSNNTAAAENKQSAKKLLSDVLTKEVRDAFSPDDVITRLKDGNERFIRNDLTERDHSQQVRKSTYAQHPSTIVLSCIDSRVPVEDVFDKGIGDLFVARVAGNFVNEDILGSMEYACKVAGSKLILVLGHEHCGAVKAAIDDVKLGNITPMLTKIKPAVGKTDYQGERTAKNKDFVRLVSASNVRNTVEQVKAGSPILKEMAEKGEIKIVGALYDMDDGKVEFFE